MDGLGEDSPTGAFGHCKPPTLDHQPPGQLPGLEFGKLVVVIQGFGGRFQDSRVGV